MGETQLFGEELPARLLVGRLCEMSARARQRPQVAFAREKDRLAGGGPSGRAQDPLAQLGKTLSGLRRDSESAQRCDEVWMQIDLVVHVHARALRPDHFGEAL